MDPSESRQRCFTERERERERERDEHKDTKNGPHSSALTTRSNDLYILDLALVT
jgi:hypothetical protein